jgi:hypothetical protein
MRLEKRRTTRGDEKEAYTGIRFLALYTVNPWIPTTLKGEL